MVRWRGFGVGGVFWWALLEGFVLLGLLRGRRVRNGILVGEIFEKWR